MNKRKTKAAKKKDAKARKILGADAQLLEMHKCIDRETARKWRKDHNKNKYPSERWFEKELNGRGFKIPVRNMRLCNDRFFGDFVWEQERLVVEIDGRSHDEPAQMEHDKTRDRLIAAFGYKVVRIRHNNIRQLAEFFKIWESKLKLALIDPPPPQASVQKVNKKKLIKQAMHEKSASFAKITSLKRKVRNAVHLARSLNRGSSWLEKEFLKIGVTVEQAKKMYF